MLGTQPQCQIKRYQFPKSTMCTIFSDRTQVPVALAMADQRASSLKLCYWQTAFLTTSSTCVRDGVEGCHLKTTVFGLQARGGGAQLLETWRCSRGRLRSSRTDMRPSSGSSGEIYTASRCRRGAPTRRMRRFNLPTRQLSRQRLSLCTTCKPRRTGDARGH
jgi:hypothetical protein